MHTRICRLIYVSCCSHAWFALFVIQVLEEVQEFHQIETSLQIKQFLADTRVYLTKMIRTVNIKETMLNTIAIVSDFSYAWEIISDYIPLMHDRIQKGVLFIRRFGSYVARLLPSHRLNLCYRSQIRRVCSSCAPRF